MDEGAAAGRQWDWHDAVLADLEPDLSLAPSHTLWEDLLQSEEEIGHFFETTPTSEMRNAQISSEKGTDETVPHMKKPRMLQFSSQHAQIERHGPSAELSENYGNNSCMPDFSRDYLAENSPLWCLMDEEPSSGSDETGKELYGGSTALEKSGQRAVKLAMPVVYPFEVVKPSGVQGDPTLNDINRHINQMGPNVNDPHRRQRHHDQASSTNSMPSSRREVVALTKIHTEGNGSITIMRTRK